MRADQVLSDLNELVATAEVDGLCALAAALTSAAAHAAARCLQAQGRRPQTRPDEDHMLTAKQTAAVMGVSTRWVYEHAHELPFTKRLGGETIRFSERGLRAWIESRRP